MAGTLAAFVGLVKTESKEESKTRKIANWNVVLESIGKEVV